MSKHESEAQLEGQVVATHSLVVIMDQRDDCKVNYKVVLDSATREKVEITPRQLSERGECIAHLGIRALAWMLMDESIEEALDRAPALQRKTERASRFELASGAYHRVEERVIN